MEETITFAIRKSHDNKCLQVTWSHYISHARTSVVILTEKSMKPFVFLEFIHNSIHVT